MKSSIKKCKPLVLPPEGLEPSKVRVPVDAGALSLRQRESSELFGSIEWGVCGGDKQGDGFLRCPGMHLHTDKDGPKDCIIYLKTVPTIKCQHTSCRGFVKALNTELRKRIGAAEAALDIGSPSEPASLPGDRNGEVPPVPLDEAGLALLLDDTAQAFKSWFVTRPELPTILALFVAHSYAVPFFDTVAYLHIFSPTKKAGKSNLLFCLSILCFNAWQTSNLTGPALFTIIEKHQPTLLLDQVENLLADRENKAEMHGMLADGYKRYGKVYRCKYDKGRRDVEEFKVFCPKAFSGVCELSEDIADRCIPIPMRTQAKAPYFYPKTVRKVLEPLHARWLAWSKSKPALSEDLTEAELPIPELDGRQCELCEPLLRVAKLAGEAWFKKGEESLMSIFGKYTVETTGVKDLRDIMAVWSADEDEMTGPEIFDALVEDGRTDRISYRLLNRDKNGDSMASDDQKGRWVRERLKAFEVKPARHAHGRYYLKSDLEAILAEYPAP